MIKVENSLISALSKDSFLIRGEGSKEGKLVCWEDRASVEDINLNQKNAFVSPVGATSAASAPRGSGLLWLHLMCFAPTPRQLLSCEGCVGLSALAHITNTGCLEQLS